MKKKSRKKNFNKIQDYDIVRYLFLSSKKLYLKFFLYNQKKNFRYQYHKSADTNPSKIMNFSIPGRKKPLLRLLSFFF